MQIKYKDGNGDYSITVHTDKTATVKHHFNGKELFNKSYTTLENAKLALSRYCDGMPSFSKGIKAKPRGQTVLHKSD